jgi:hypothetical protein
LLKTAIERCAPDGDAPVVIFVAKMVNIPKENITEMTPKL